MGEAMLQAVLGSLPSALGIALSPLPVAAVILMLFSERATANGLSFVVGWMAGLAVVAALVVFSGLGAASPSGGPSLISGVVRILLGLLLGFMAIRNWRSRASAGEAPEAPAWMASIGGFTAVKAFGVAALLSGVNPKNLALNVSAVSAMQESGLAQQQLAGAVVVFIVLASLSVALPVIYRLVAGQRATVTLDGWKTWLIANNGTVMAVLFSVFSVKLLSEGLRVVIGG
jgi:threonine/homoserine/homoserine lactone efflux protein